MNRVIIRLDALHHNLHVIDGWIREHGASWTVVTKVLCGHRDTLRALWAMGVRSMGDSRLGNVSALHETIPEPGLDTWYLRVPHLSSVGDVARVAGVSLNSETMTIKALSQEASRQGKKHRIIIMIELGDLREGILPGSLVRFYEEVFDLPHLEVLGIGSNLGCISGQIPTVDQYMQLVLYRELLELKFGRRLPLISAGSSVALRMMLDGQLPKAINHFRIGESLFLGNDLISGEPLPGLRTDTIVLEAEIVEIKKKSLVPVGPGGGVAPFAPAGDGAQIPPGQRGYRVLINIGQLDADIQGMTPEDPTFQIAGASSDITVVNVGDEPGGLVVGGMMRFRLNYAAMLRLMSGPYVPKVVEPDIAEFENALPEPPGLASPKLTVPKPRGEPMSRPPHEAKLTPELAQSFRRDREVWDACASTYEDRIVHGHPDVQAYLDFEEDLLDRLLLYLARDCDREIRLHDVGCGSGRLHLRYGRRMAAKAGERDEPCLAQKLMMVSGLDFSAQMLALARRKLCASGLEPLIGTRLLLEEGSAFEMTALPAKPLPVAVALCNTLGVMQGPAGASRLFSSMRKVAEAGGLAMVSCYRAEAVQAFALGNYESTMDVSGQPRWLVPADFAVDGNVLVPRHYKRAYDRDATIIVDVRSRDGSLVRSGLLLTRDPRAVAETARTGHVRTYTDYESRWYSQAQIDAWVAEHWSGATTFHVLGRSLDALRGEPVQLAFVDFSGLLAGFLERYRA